MKLKLPSVSVLKNLVAKEPVLAKGGLGLLVSAGILTASQANTVGSVLAGVAAVVGLLLARGPKPSAKK